MALMKLFTEVFTPAVDHVPFRAYSKTCPIPPPPPSPVNPPPAGISPPPVPPPPAMNFKTISGVPVVCYLYWLGSDPASFGYGSPAIPLTACIPLSQALSHGAPQIQGAVLVRKLGAVNGTDCDAVFDGCVAGQFVGPDRTYISDQSCDTPLQVCSQ